MAQTLCVSLSVFDRMRLEAISSDHNLPRKHVGARVVLASAIGAAGGD